MRITKRYSGLLFLLMLLKSGIYAQSILITAHNLSASGPGDIRAVSESEVCVFCHTPHSSLPSSPLWNKEDPGYSYILYNSSTAEAVPGQPDGASILCLSCHDGTTALGSVLSRTNDITFSYLGYLTDINYQKSEVDFIVNKGGIIEKIKIGIK